MSRMKNESLETRQSTQPHLWALVFTAAIRCGLETDHRGKSFYLIRSQSVIKSSLSWRKLLSFQFDIFQRLIRLFKAACHVQYVSVSSLRREHIFSERRLLSICVRFNVRAREADVSSSRRSAMGMFGGLFCGFPIRGCETRYLRLEHLSLIKNVTFLSWAWSIVRHIKMDF